MAINVGNIAGLWALLALVPLIIMYLIRPKPTNMNIPSLMFFVQSSGSRKLTSFLRQITRDWLFLIQLLLLTAVALSFAEPYTTYEYDITASNTVLIIDVSASSQVREGISTRFSQIISEARKRLSSSNTIVLAKDIPYIALQEANSAEASKFLSSLQPRETASKIGDAMILGGETLKDKGLIVVISDFMNTGGQIPEVAKSVLESKGHVVEFINVADGKKSNIGIVQLDVRNAQTTAYIKNYNDNLENVDFRVGNTQTKLSVKPLSVETYSFATPAGITKMELLNRDDFAVDNVAFVSAPEAGKVSVLLIANKEAFLSNALLASGDFEVKLAEPPVVPDGDFDVYVLSAVDIKQVLPGTFEDLREKAEEGAAVIVVAQDNSDKIDYKGLLPVKLGPKIDGGFVSIEQLNRFTKNIDFGQVNVLHSAELVGEQLIIAGVNEVPVLTIRQAGAGKLVYFGISEDNDFKFSPHYPIFWTEFVKYLTEQQDVKNLNFKTGESLLLGEEQVVKTPAQTVKKTALVLDEQGVYELKDRKIAVNLLNELESDVNRAVSVGVRSENYELQPVKETREFNLELVLLSLALILTVFEVFFIKYRGDL